MRPESSRDMGEPLEITWSSGTVDLSTGWGDRRQGVRQTWGNEHFHEHSVCPKGRCGPSTGIGQ